MIVKTIDEVKKYVVEKLTAVNVDKQAAEVVADSLAYADARGTKSHGLNMLPAYIERIEKGGIDVKAKNTILKDGSTYVAMDGNNGFGQTALSELKDTLLKKAENSPIVCGTVSHMNHCGALSYYSEDCARKGKICFLFVNANPTVAAFGGMEAVLGTNPFSVAVPNGEKPIILDMASSNVAKAKIYAAAKTGQKIDPSWALNKEGYPTDDPNEAINGVLTPMGGPKGYGLALVIETMAGVLSGAGITNEVLSVHKKTDECMNAGAFMILVDPYFLFSKEEYAERISHLVDSVKNSKPQPGKTIFMPGEIEINKIDVSKENGIEYDEKFFD